MYSQLDRSAQVASWISLGVVVVAILAPVIAPYGPAEPDYGASLVGPSMQHPMGTDLTGRDVFSRVLFGARTSLIVGVVAVAMAVAIGVPLGSIAGYLGGWTDDFIMRSMDVLISVPALVLGLALVGAIGASLENIIFVIGVVYSPQYARLIRGSVLSVKDEEVAEATENIGFGHLTILGREIIPNAMSPVLVQATYHVATAIILEASLSFLGLGVQPPRPTWGVMISNGQEYLPSEWWISTFPGLAIMITVLSFNVFGDGLQDVADPRSETEAGVEA